MSPQKKLLDCPTVGLSPGSGATTAKAKEVDRRWLSKASVGQAAALHQQFNQQANPTAKGDQHPRWGGGGVFFFEAQRRIPKLMPRRARVASASLKKGRADANHGQSCPNNLRVRL